MSQTMMPEPPGDSDAQFWIDVGPVIGAELERRARANGPSPADLARRVLLQWIAQTEATDSLSPGMLHLDPLKRIAAVAGRQVRLSPLETKILNALLQHAGRPVPADTMSFLVWGRPLTNKKLLAVHISHLRDKLRPSVRIQALRDSGYWIELASDSAPYSR